MFKERKEYRKNLISAGQMYIAGEWVSFSTHDVSVNGVLVEVKPAQFLATFDDFQALLSETNRVEMYVEDLMLTGEADIAWCRQENGKIFLGLEFKDMIYNAEKLWRKRLYYRSTKAFSGDLIIDDRRYNFTGFNRSVDGMGITVKDADLTLKPGYIVKLMLDDSGTKALASVIWSSKPADGVLNIGLRYFSIT